MGRVLVALDHGAASCPKCMWSIARTCQFSPQAPTGLWVFGERGYADVMCQSESEFERYKRLFPEAAIWWELRSGNNYLGRVKNGVPVGPSDGAPPFKGDDLISRTIRPS